MIFILKTVKSSQAVSEEAEYGNHVRLCVGKQAAIIPFCTSCHAWHRIPSALLQSKHAIRKSNFAGKAIAQSNPKNDYGKKLMPESF
jgi:hypothetical protein